MDLIDFDRPVASSVWAIIHASQWDNNYLCEMPIDEIVIFNLKSLYMAYLALSVSFEYLSNINSLFCQRGYLNPYSAGIPFRR